MAKKIYKITVDGLTKKEKKKLLKIIKKLARKLYGKA